MGGQHEDPLLGAAGAELLEGVEAIACPKGQVEEDEVGGGGVEARDADGPIAVEAQETVAVVDAPAGPVKATVPDAKQPTQEPAPRQVEDPPQTASDALAPWAVGGFVDTQYIVNSNSPDNHIFRGTPVSARTGEFSPNLIVGYVRRDPIKSPWMFELALQPGVAADALYYTEPVAGGTAGRFAGVETWKHIGRAWTGVKLRGGTEVFVGAVLLPVLMCSAGGLGDQAALERLIASGAEVDAADYDGRTALHLAAAEGQVAAAALLLAKGARVSAVDRWGGTPIVDAVRHRHRHRPVVTLLRRHGAPGGRLPCRTRRVRTRPNRG